MSYFHLDKSQARHIRDLVKGKVVADLGCGMGMLTRMMARWGASRVHGVDKESFPRRNSTKVQWHLSYLAYWKMPADVEVAVVSWPQNSPLQGLRELLQAVPHVVYIGKNTDGTACGNPTLMRYLSERAAIHHITTPKNVLIHYGPGPRPFPYVYHEEFAGMNQEGNSLPYNPDTARYTENEWRAKVQRA